MYCCRPLSFPHHSAHFFGRTSCAVHLKSAGPLPPLPLSVFPPRLFLFFSHTLSTLSISLSCRIPLSSVRHFLLFVRMSQDYTRRQVEWLHILSAHNCSWCPKGLSTAAVLRGRVWSRGSGPGSHPLYGRCRAIRVSWWH